jgi:hypothetical protein
MQPGNVLKIDTLNEDWSDKDKIMLHACFQLLKDCIEKEKLLTGFIDWTLDDKSKKVNEEIEYLNNWWIERVQLERNKDIDPVWTAGQYEIDDEMLIRLIKIRRYLWT